MEKRVYGLETEYGVVALSLDDSCYDDYEASTCLGSFYDEIFRPIAPLVRASARDCFYLNGARIYQDIGEHPEYATPECAGIKDLVKWDKAGERIFEEAMLKANEVWGNETKGLRLYKNNVDMLDYSTFGCHENYLVSKRILLETLRDILVPFLVSRQIICGAGCIDQDGFRISQRSVFISEIANYSSTQSRPIFHTKDETWANSSEWRRLHLILGDANMSEVSTFLKVGTTALMLRMIEDQFLVENKIILPDTVQILKKISRDTSCRLTFGLESPVGSGLPDLISAVGLQEYYLAAAREYVGQLGTDGSEWREVIGRWEDVLSALKENPMRLNREIDWVIKKWLMEAVLERYDCDWTTCREKSIGTGDETVFNYLKTVDFLYHDIRREIGLYNLLVKEGLVERLIGEEDVERAKLEPPKNTRAQWRGDFIRRAQALSKSESFNKDIKFKVVNWDTLGVLLPFYLDKNKLADYSGFGFGSSYKYCHREDPLDGRPAEELDEIINGLNSA